jgi:hypothetical protein
MLDNYNKEGLKKRIWRLGAIFNKTKLCGVQTGNNVVGPDPIRLGIRIRTPFLDKNAGSKIKNYCCFTLSKFSWTRKVP